MKQTNDVNVLVVGGGAAGLAAAVAAEQAGLTCQVLEAQDRLGGRVRTVPLESGGVFDEGAQLVNGDMGAVLEVAAQAGLHPAPVARGGIYLCMVGEEALRAEDLISVEEIYELLEEQVVSWDSFGEALRALRLKWKWWNTPWESVGEAGRGLKLLVEKQPFHRDSLAAALRALLLSPEEHAIAFSLFSEILGGPPEEINAHAVRDLFARYASERDDAEFHFSRGMVMIIDQLASSLRRTPRLGAPVRHIRHLSKRVEATTDAGSWTADAVVVAVPPTVATKITFDMPDADDLVGLLSSFRAGDMIKTLLVFDTPFWRLGGFSGSATFADPPGLAVMDGSLDDGSPPRLVAFQGGPLARKWAALPKSERQARLLRRLSEAFGDQTRAPREIAEAVWVDHPWSGGGYNAFVRAGGNPDAVARLAAWGGRVRFAGAEIDDRFWGYVEGAVHSGRAVIARIIGGAGRAAA
ncbi:MAG: NAD(P)/FAD-dependent oxidoreductase [Pseudomonadota bacterium]